MVAGDLAAVREVPTFEEHVYRPKATDFCVCVFALNENGRLHQQLQRMKAYAGLADIIVADGGSKDASTDRSILERLDVNTLLVKTGAGGLGAQMRMAFASALERGYRGAITIDGNNKDDPEALPRFVDRLQAGFDHVQGSRFLPGGISENLPLSRSLGLRLIHAPLIRLASGFSYTDTTNGFRAYSARLLSDSRVAVFRDVFNGYELHYYLAIRAARLGFRVTEVPVARRYPAKGPVPTKISPFRGNLRVLRCLANACLGRYNPRS
jgi:dolichol-phosphate mannosyltransferase